MAGFLGECEVPELGGPSTCEGGCVYGALPLPRLWHDVFARCAPLLLTG